VFSAKTLGLAGFNLKGKCFLEDRRSVPLARAIYPMTFDFLNGVWPTASYPMTFDFLSCLGPALIIRWLLISLVG